jgi:hypothetical protein
MPSVAPTYGERILRVFYNANPNGEPRVWRVGEPFADMARRMLPRIPRQWPGSAALMAALKITKRKRSAYDHLMLHLHDAMKADMDYQRTCPQETMPFPPGCGWVCFSDHASHAVMSGQFMLEQTFWLPAQDMADPARSPLAELQAITGAAAVNKPADRQETPVRLLFPAKPPCRDCYSPSRANRLQSPIAFNQSAARIMSTENNAPVVSNFIRNIIDEDLASGKHSAIVTRFPPEPNGYLHVGHAKSICLNFGLAEDYQGKCNLRMDDTNPEKESDEFVQTIKDSVEWLGFQWDGNVRFASDYFDALYDYAVELIKSGKAFVCDLNAEEMRAYRGSLTEPGKNSPFRDRSVEENLDLFTRMRNGEFPDGSKTLRLKIDMASGNVNLRDPVIYRIRRAHHHRTGDKWCIYPMYDYTHCISDALEGITHSLCTLEFEDHRPLYDWVLDNITILATRASTNSPVWNCCTR